MSVTLNTSEEWLQYANTHQRALLDLISEYHPGMRKRRKSLPITAPGAEMTCEVVRIAIAQDSNEFLPDIRFQTALATGDISAIISILNGAWFGVPESTSCWQITGFREAVELLEQRPEPDEGPLMDLLTGTPDLLAEL